MSHVSLFFPSPAATTVAKLAHSTWRCSGQLFTRSYARLAASSCAQPAGIVHPQSGSLSVVSIPPPFPRSMPLESSLADTLHSRRCYHASDHPNERPPQDTFNNTEQAILAAATRYIPEYGFSNRAVALGAQDAGYPSISTAILPDGVFSLVRWHLVNQRVALAKRNRQIFGLVDTTQVNQRAERLAWERLLANKDVIGRWQEALAIMAQPSYVPASLRELALLSDEIWALAGDTAVDPAWYSRRAGMVATYAASEIFMTTDSGSYTATREFLHRRFHESQELGGYVQSVGQWVGFAAGAGVNVLRSKGLGI